MTVVFVGGEAVLFKLEGDTRLVLPLLAKNFSHGECRLMPIAGFIRSFGHVKRDGERNTYISYLLR